MSRDRLGRLPWLLPASYLIHIAEEYRGGFPAWLNSLAGARLTDERFLELNAFGLLAMTLGVLAGTSLRPARVLLVAFATAVLVNAALHVGATIVTARYSPGALSGLILWVPVGATLLTRLRRDVAGPIYLLGVGAGLALHGLITLAAIRGGG